MNWNEAILMHLILQMPQTPGIYNVFARKRITRLYITVDFIALLGHLYCRKVNSLLENLTRPSYVDAIKQTQA